MKNFIQLKKKGKKKKIYSKSVFGKSKKIYQKHLKKKIAYCNLQGIIKQQINISLKITPLHKELILIGAFIGNHYKWTHFSQSDFIIGYKNNYVFYDIEKSIIIFARATRFLKNTIKNKNSNFVFVGNPVGAEEESILMFKNINLKFFPNEIWKPGYFSRKSSYSNFILVIYDITQNNIAFQEAIKGNIPVVAFLTPICDVRGVDYPILLNLKNSEIWFAQYCRALFIKKYKLNDTKHR